MGGEPGAGLVFVPAVALVLAYPVPHGAVREASVGLLLARAGVGDLGTVHHPLWIACVISFQNLYGLTVVLQ